MATPAAHTQEKAPQLTFTPHQGIQTIYDATRAAFDCGRTRTLEWRLNQIRQIGYMIQEKEDRWSAALASDLGRPQVEGHITELIGIKDEVNETLKQLATWLKPKKVKTSLAYAAMNPTICREPKGIVLILGTWNYPISVTLSPLLGAISGGNSCVLKPAEQAPATARLLSELIPQYLDNEAIQVVNGSVEENQLLLKLKWDHIFFTGSGGVGKIVARAAAEHLTPVTLELGGKSPVILFDDADITTAGRRLIWGKLVNAGQTCIAPDYILAPTQLHDQLIESMKNALAEFYPAHASLTESDQFGKIINQHHFGRLSKILAATTGEVMIGGQIDAVKNKIAVTVIKGVQASDVTMQEEIFGPILPILTCETAQEAIKFVNSRDVPLALYVFTKCRKNMELVRNTTRSGQIVYNDVLVQYVIPGLPFGGTGPSGYGNYHGHHSFLTFTHERSCATVPSWLELLLGSRYPPYTLGKLKLLNFLSQSRISGRSSVSGSGGGSGENATTIVKHNKPTTSIVAWALGTTTRGKVLRGLLTALMVWWWTTFD